MSVVESIGVAKKALTQRCPGTYPGHCGRSERVVFRVPVRPLWRSTSCASPAASCFLPAVDLFGSYARGAATADRDIDPLIDTTGTKIKSLLQLAAVYRNLEKALGKPVDLATVSSPEQKAQMPGEKSFRKTVWDEYLCRSLTDSGWNTSEIAVLRAERR